MIKVDYLHNIVRKENMTDPRDALDMTIKLFGIKAVNLSKAAGIDKSSLSRYRHKTQDIQGQTAFAIMAALPTDARDFFCKLITEEETEIPRKLADSSTKYTVNIRS